MKSRKGCFFISVIVVVMMITVLCAGLGMWRATAVAGERPILRVLQPQPNASLTAFSAITVQATAEGRRTPIRWLRFYVDNLLAGEKMGPNASLVGAWRWTPNAPGVHTLTFVAANEQGIENMVTLQNTAVAADRDNDTSPDELDACPDQTGAPMNNGCPISNDVDNDGLPDDQDICPQEAGLPEEHGCQPWNRPDQDGDGVADWNDHCPSIPGRPEWNGCPQEGLILDDDADGLVDTIDNCPLQPGPQENQGCPVQQANDQDGDGILDSQDSCSNQAGSPLNNGCPVENDRDGDGVPDASDQCPDIPGWRESNGCLPENWILDSDHDGVPDFLDRCDGERGSFLHWGCPSAQDRDNDGISDDEDNCLEREGPAWNGGCPQERLLVKGKSPNIVCGLFPDLCAFGDVELSSNGETCPNDRDCDGVIDLADECPDQFGVGSGQILDGCPLDWNGNGQPDESDTDGDGVPNQMDACPDQLGPLSNSGCSRPEGQSMEVNIELLGFWTRDTFQNFYCYVQIQGSDWVRLPEEGSLPRSGSVYSVNQQVSLTVTGNQPIRIVVRCEGQTDPSSPVQDLSRIQRQHGLEYWHCNWMDAWSDSGELFAEYRICEE